MLIFTQSSGMMIEPAFTFVVVFISRFLSQGIGFARRFSSRHHDVTSIG